MPNGVTYMALHDRTVPLPPLTVSPSHILLVLAVLEQRYRQGYSYEQVARALAVAARNVLPENLELYTAAVLRELAALLEARAG